MDYAYCPRCGTERMSGRHFCGKCGYDFKARPDADEAEGGFDDPDEPYARGKSPRDVRPVSDRRTIAQWSRDALTVRCLAALGGIVGAFIGFIVFALIAGAVHAGLFGAFLALMGFPVGYFVGVRVALGRMAR